MNSSEISSLLSLNNKYSAAAAAVSYIESSIEDREVEDHELFYFSTSKVNPNKYHYLIKKNDELLEKMVKVVFYIFTYLYAEIADFFHYQQNQEALLASIKQQISVDLPRANIKIDGIQYSKEEDVDTIYNLVFESFQGDKRKALETMSLLHQGAAAYPMMELSDIFLGKSIEEKMLRMQRLILQDKPSRAEEEIVSERYCPLNLEFNTSTGKVDLVVSSYLNFIGRGLEEANTLRDISYHASYDLKNKTACKRVYSRTPA